MESTGGGIRCTAISTLFLISAGFRNSALLSKTLGCGWALTVLMDKVEKKTSA